MLLHSCFRSLDAHGPRIPAQRSRRRAAAARSVPPRLLLEPLEERALPSFLPPLSFAAGYSPVSVAVGEFNGDGRPDLAVANYDGGAVSVLLSNGDGTFQARVNYPAGNYPRSVAVGEFNGDGFTDIAVTSFYCDDKGCYNESGVLLGNGDGTFRAPAYYYAGLWPYFVAVGEFNGDGLADLAVVNLSIYPSPGTVSVLLGNGDGTFQVRRTFAAGYGASSVAVGDFNGDGLADLAVGNNSASGNVSVLLGNGDGTFQAARHFAAGSYTYSVAVGEFNGDGRLDLAVANLGGTVSVLLGNGDGTFQAARNFFAGSRPYSVAVGEFNGDGLPDLAVANLDNVSVLLGNGDGTFQAAQNFAAGSGPLSVAVGEFDGDGWSDLAVANAGSNDVSILLNAADDAAIFYVYAPESAPAGQPFDLAVFALSGTGQLAHGYRSTVAFVSTDAAATLPEPYRFRPADRGIALFPGGGALRTLGPQVILALDLNTFTVFGFAFVDVLAPAPGGGGAVRPALDLFLAEVLAGGSKPTRP